MPEYKTSSLRIEQKAIGTSEMFIALFGDVNETFKADKINTMGCGKVVFDLSGVENFNSIGIREWSNALLSLAQKGIEVIYTRCSVVMMDQFNLVPESLGGGLIVSFFAPYYCQDHGEVNELLEYDQITHELLTQTAPKRLCPQCQKVMDFDALAESYFQFHRHLTRRT